MDSTAVRELTAINVDDLLASLGLEKVRRGRGLLRSLFWFAGRRFARQVLDYDDGVERMGLQAGAERILNGFINSRTVTGVEHLPATGPLLILANHPGMTDTVALFASLPRADLKVVASDRPFLRALPATCRHLIFVPEHGEGRIAVLRSIAAHLRAGGAVLTFPAGDIEPDPACMPGALRSLERWSDSIGFFSRLVPDACIVPAIISGVIAPQSLAHPLTRLRRRQKDREKLAASLQIFVRSFAPRLWPVHVKVQFGPPLPSASLAGIREPGAATQVVIEHVRAFLLENDIVNGSA